MARRHRTWKVLGILGVLAVAAAGWSALVAAETSLPAGTAVAQAPDQAAAAGAQKLVAGTAVMAAPARYTPRATTTPVEPTAEARATREAFMERAEQAWARRVQAVANRLALAPQSLTQAEPLDPATATEAPEPDFLDGPTQAAVGPQAPGTFDIHLRSDLMPPFSSSINEPAVASSGRYVFYTNNWYAARSFSHGTGSLSWLYVDPEADMPDFCCDQDVIYDKGRDMFVWERMGISPVGAQNRVRLGVSTNGNFTFCNYDFTPAGIGLPNGFYDYPRLALSNDELYWTINVFDNGPSGDFIANVLLRVPLDEMSTCSGFTYYYWVLPQDGWSPAAVENAREVMYLGDNPAYFDQNTVFRVLWQPESELTLYWVDRTIAPYAFTAPVPPYQAVCRVPGGRNPCARADQRVIGGVLARDQVDFFWNVKEGGSFPYPYVESAGFDTQTLTYNARKFVWNDTNTWFYAAVGANDREHVGMSVLFFSPQAQSRHYVAIDDDYNPSPPGWEVAFVRASVEDWTTNASGDYLRARSSHPQGVGWIGTGYTRQTGHYEPHFVEWRRGRDERGTNRFQYR